jgi:hypothetical protein
LQDPDGHRERQRELIAELDEARKKLEKEPPKKKSFSLFSRNKRMEKKDWETYDESTRDDGEVSPRRTDEESPSGFLFDVDAIRAELVNEQIEVKQLESTLPPMKLDLKSKLETSNGSRMGLKHSQSSNSGLTSTSAPHYHSGSSLDTSPLSPTGHMDGSRPSPHPQSPRTPDPRSSFEPHHRESPSSSPSVDRPPLKTSQTLPIQMTSLDHNAWADEEDEFGREKEVTMSFE